MLAMSGFGWFRFGILGLIILMALAFWPARVARSKGLSWLLFFIFSVLPVVPP
jgi:hypothetical protein